MRGKYDFVLEDGEATIESLNPAVEWICMGGVAQEPCHVDLRWSNCGCRSEGGANPEHPKHPDRAQSGVGKVFLYFETDNGTEAENFPG